MKLSIPTLAELLQRKPSVPSYDHGKQIGAIQALSANTAASPETGILDAMKPLTPTAPKENTVATNKFISILENIGKWFQKGLAYAVEYLPSASAIAALIFPPAVAPLAAATATADLLQKAVITVEQKYAAAGVQNGTGVQKAAEVLSLTNQAVTTLLADPTITKELAAAGITVDSTYISNLINAVVGILNVKGATASETKTA